MRPGKTDIGVYSGGFFDVFNPNPDDIRIEDIAHALSLTCRWGGHCREFYSVAQHCVHVSDLLPLDLALQGLLHDAAEAYMGDVPRPIKHNIPAFGEQEDKVLRVIWDKFGLEGQEMHEQIHAMDNRVLHWEAHELLVEHEWADNPYPNMPLSPWKPHDAEDMFLIAYEELTGESTNRRRYFTV